MKKKVALTAAAVAMVGTLAVGGTLAWFTDTETATNVVTTGSVDIAILEKGENGDFSVVENGDTGVTIENAVPGKTYEKDAKIQNTGNNPAWVRAKVVLFEVAEDGTETETVNLPEGMEIVGMEDGWVKNAADPDDVYYYYTQALPSDNDTALLMSGVTLDGDKIGNQYIDKNYSIRIFAEAIQSENTGDNAVDAFAGKEIADLEVDMLD